MGILAQRHQRRQTRIEFHITQRPRRRIQRPSRRLKFRPRRHAKQIRMPPRQLVQHKLQILPLLPGAKFLCRHQARPKQQTANKSKPSNRIRHLLDAIAIPHPIQPPLHDTVSPNKDPPKTPFSPPKKAKGPNRIKSVGPFKSTFTFHAPRPAFTPVGRGVSFLALLLPAANRCASTQKKQRETKRTGFGNC